MVGINHQIFHKVKRHIMASERAMKIAKNLQTMANHASGNEHENANALRLLEEWMVKNEISWEDLEETKRETFYFKVDSLHEKRFFIQMFFSVVGDDGDGHIREFKITQQQFKSLKMKHGQRMVEYECAKHEKVLIVETMQFFWSHWEREHDLFYKAFIQKNRLFSNPDRTKPSEGNGMTDDEFWRMTQMAAGIKKKTMALKLPDSIQNDTTT